MHRLRLLAAVLVVFVHAASAVTDRVGPVELPGDFGRVGVAIFFVVSGFVMATSGEKLTDSSDGWRVFLKRRVIRIVPMYWLATTLKVVIFVATPGLVLHSTLDGRNLFFSYLFLPSLNSEGEIYPFHTVGWTLIYEMFFYALFALGLFLRTNPVIFSSLALVSIVVLGWFLGPAGFVGPHSFYSSSITMFFVAGMALRLLTNTTSKVSSSWLLGLVSVVWIVSNLLESRPAGRLFDVEDFLTNHLIVAGVYIVIFFENQIRAWRTGIIDKLSDASYSIYLFHPFVVPAIPLAFAQLQVEATGVAFAGAVIAGVLAPYAIYLLAEKPVTLFLRKSWK